MVICGFCRFVVSDNSTTIKKLITFCLLQFPSNFGKTCCLVGNRRYDVQFWKPQNCMVDNLPLLWLFMESDIELRQMCSWKIISYLHPSCATETAVWRYSNDPEALVGLRDLLAKTEFVIRACVQPYSTQLNEAYHAIKSHVLEKEIAWRATTPGRPYLALLIFINLTPGWRNWGNGCSSHHWIPR